VVNVYENADKIFNICKGYPIGTMSWGAGSIGPTSISTLVKDFRKRLTDNLIGKGYKIQAIAESFAKFMYEEHYVPAYGKWERKPAIGFIVAGYSKDQDFAEEWILEILEGNLKGPEILRGQNETGITWNGEPEAITRLFLGYSPDLPNVLRECNLENEKIAKIIAEIRPRLMVPLYTPPMPIKDVIDLAEFLVETTIKFSRFKPGAPTVGGPIEIATITKHEGFKWIKRKHYYDARLNLPIIKLI